MSTAHHAPTLGWAELPGYEGWCDHCGRDIGTGHEPGCPYHHAADKD